MLKCIQGQRYIIIYVTIVTLKLKLSGECIYFSSGSNFLSLTCAIDLKCHLLKLNSSSSSSSLLGKRFFKLIECFFFFNTAPLPCHLNMHPKHLIR